MEFWDSAFQIGGGGLVSEERLRKQVRNGLLNVGGVIGIHVGEGGPSNAFEVFTPVGLTRNG